MLTAEEQASVMAAMAAVGSDEVSVSDDGSLQGNGTIDYTASGAGIDVKVSTKLGCKGVLDRTRMEWRYTMDLQRVGGDEAIYALDYQFVFMSFGTNTEGHGVVLYDYSRGQHFSGDHETRKFADGEIVSFTQLDHSSFIQWGYFLAASCDITTSDGTITV